MEEGGIMAVQVPQFNISGRNVTPSAKGLSAGISGMMGRIREDKQAKAQETERVQNEELFQISFGTRSQAPEDRSQSLLGRAQQARGQGNDELADELERMAGLDAATLDSELVGDISTLGKRLGINTESILRSQQAAPARTQSLKREELFKDTKDNFFTATTQIGPDGNVQNVITAVGGAGDPVGALSPVSRTTGLTGTQSGDLKARTAANVQEAKDIAALKTEASKEQQKILGRTRATISRDIKTAAIDSRRSLPKLKALKKSLDLVATGKVAQAKNVLGPFLPGVDPTDTQVLSAQIFGAANELLRNSPGTKTDFDFQAAVTEGAQLGNTPEANKQIIDLAMRYIQDKQDERVQLIKFEKGGGFAEDFIFEAPEIEDQKQTFTSKSGIQFRVK